MRRTTTAILLCVGAFLSGCSSSSKPADIAIAPDQYPAAFDAVKRVLRDANFDLERVDARAGVITTASKATAGLATPWDGEQQSMEAEFEDLLQHQKRAVRITFEPGATSPDASSPPVIPGEGTYDLLEESQPTTMRIRVLIERVNRPNWRVDSTSIRLYTYAVDPELVRGDMAPRYNVVIANDPDFEAELTRRIQTRLAGE